MARIAGVDIPRDKRVDFQRILQMIHFENFEVGTAVSAILSCENAKQVQGGTVRGKRRYD